MSERAFLVATGQELLAEKIDTNSVYIAQELAVWGIETIGKMIVGDEQTSIARAMQVGLKEAKLIICSGGLGPTFDDLTRDALSEVTGQPMEVNPLAQAQIEAYFSFRAIPMPPSNLRQAMLPRGAVPLYNPNGTAPGVWMEYENKFILLLPGPPGEMKPMLAHVMEKELVPRLHLVKQPAACLKIQTCGIGESSLAECLGAILTDPPEGIRMAILAHLGQVTVEAESRLGELAVSTRLLQEVKDRVLERAGEYVYGYGEDTLEKACHQLLLKHNLCLAVAESCTGGWLAKTITDLPGSSTYFWGGLCTYDNLAKQKVLGVPTDHLEQFGAVSAEVARDMAAGLKALSAADVTIGITGIAGPGGGSEQKPVGTVYISLMHADICEVKHFIMAGGRDMVRRRTVTTALSMLWKLLKSW